MPLLRLKRPLAIAALIVAPVFAASAPAIAAPDKPAAADVQKATALFVKGTELFKANKFALALEQFKQSYALVASPNSHLYIARCIAAVGQARAAWIEFDRTADEATAGGAKYAPTHDSAIQERDDLGPKVALVTVVVPNADPGVAVRVGPYDIPPDHIGRPYPVDAGTFDVIVQAPGKPPVQQSVTTRLGDRRDVTVTAVPSGPLVPGAPPGGDTPQPAHGAKLGGLRIGAIAAGGVGVIGFIMFAAEGAASKSTYNTVNGACGGVQGCPTPIGGRATVNSEISSGKTQQAVANAGLAIGVIGVATGATLLALSFRRAPDSGRPSGELVLGPSWAGVRGSF
jgi:hypothetical protein